MIYPFLYNILDTVNVDEILESFTKKNTVHTVWDDWNLEEIDSIYIQDYVSKKFSGLKLFKNKIFLSTGKTCNFHVDRYHYHHLLHRVLITLTEISFQYEWITNDGIKTFTPASGQVILFNNMIPHRFVSIDSSEKIRSVIYLDLIDPEVEIYLKHFDGNYSKKNGELANLSFK